MDSVEKIFFDMKELGIIDMSSVNDGGSTFIEYINNHEEKKKYKQFVECGGFVYTKPAK